MPAIDCLFDPFSLKSLSTENRVVMAPMTRNHSPDNSPGEAAAAYYRRRAAGGVGHGGTPQRGRGTPYLSILRRGGLKLRDP